MAQQTPAAPADMAIDIGIQNELMAIVFIVLVCVVMFVGWLVAMATCPDTIVNLLSGSGKQKKSSSTTSTRESRELLKKSDASVNEAERGERDDGEEEDHPSDLPRSVSAVLQLNAARRLEEKKLSVVDEVDEQLTLQSTIHSGGRPSILKHPVTQVVAEMHDEPKEG